MAQRAHKANLLAAIRGGILNKKESVSCANFRGDATLLAHLRQAGLIYGHKPSGVGRLVVFLKLGAEASLRREHWLTVPKLSERHYSLRLLERWQQVSRRRETWVISTVGGYRSVLAATRARMGGVVLYRIKH